MEGFTPKDFVERTASSLFPLDDDDDDGGGGGGGGGGLWWWWW